MKPFTKLTRLSKLRRMHNLAVTGLSHYGLDDSTLTYHGFETNLFYRVVTAKGERFMLRLASPGWRTLKDLNAEALWLQALGKDTSIPVPGIIPTRSGDLVLSISHPGVPDIWHMTLMRYVPGRLLGHYLTPENLEKMGALFAELHQHGATWTPPENFTQRRFEHWLSRGEENHVAAMIKGPEQQKPSKNNQTVPPVHRDVLERMDFHVEEAYRAIDRSDLRVIHCDLWHDNIKLHKGELYPFDFEDTVWGFRAHDIAMAMLDLLETVGEAHYPTLLAAFQRGYTAHLDWPEDLIEPFMVGRLLWMINWVAHNEPDHLTRMIESHVPVFTHYEQTRQVILPEN